MFLGLEEYEFYSAILYTENENGNTHYVSLSLEEHKHCRLYNDDKTTKIWFLKALDFYVDMIFYRKTNESFNYNGGCI